ncbi:hypothetical protein FDF12_15010 [Clostridium botulinum]|nr:hypothetical protein [Clostridium botulinum]NFS55201.1 hypothetical protein [Clostridium botulinum]NFT18644.1 hypothetical protein [Clostridium botulinum]
MDYTGKKGNGEYKKIPPEGKNPYKKTVYDPAGISNEEIIDLSKKAVDEGLLNNRVVPLENQHKTIIQGQVDYEGKVLKFEAYQDSYTGVVENAWPVLEWTQY